MFIIYNIPMTETESEVGVTETDTVESAEKFVDLVRQDYNKFVQDVLPEGKSIEDYPIESKESGYIATGRAIVENGLPASMFEKGEESEDYYKKHQKLEQKLKDAAEKGLQTLNLKTLQKLHENVALENEKPGKLRDETVTAPINKNGEQIIWQYPDKERVPELAQRVEEWQKKAVAAGLPRQEIGKKTAQMIIAAQLFNDANSRVADLVQRFYKAEVPKK